jgi:putative transposase
MDFVHDQFATGRKLRVLTIIDIFSRFSPALAAAVHFPWHRCRGDTGKSLQ